MRTLQTRIKMLGAILGLTLVSSHVFAMGAGHYERDGKTLRSSRKLTSSSTEVRYGNHYRAATKGVKAATTPVATATDTSQTYDPLTGKVRPKITQADLDKLKTIIPAPAPAADASCEDYDKWAKENNECIYPQVSVNSNALTVTDGKVSTAAARCDYANSEERTKYGRLFRLCGYGPQSCAWKLPACQQALREAGLGACEATAKEATDAYTNFRKACDETQIGSPEQCLAEARQCLQDWAEAEKSDEEEDEDDDFSMSALMAQFGLGSDETKKSSTNPKFCSVLGRKDWNTEKKNLDSAITDAKKEMSELKKDLDKDIKEFTDKKAEIMKSFNDAQVATREKMSEAQEAATQKGMEAQERIMEAEENKATFGAQVLKMYGEKSNLISQRAQLMAIKSDAMIAETCERTVELERAKMASGLQAGQQAYMMSRARKHKFLLELRKSCISQAQIERAGQWRELNNKISQVDNEVANLNRKSALADASVDSTQRQSQADIQKAAQVQQSLATEGTSEQQNITIQMQELQANQAQRIQTAADETKLANDKISALNTEIDALGKRPKGEKPPTEAATKFNEFASKLKAMNSTEACKDRATEILKATADIDKVRTYYDKGTNFSDEDEETSDDEGAVK